MNVQQPAELIAIGTLVNVLLNLFKSYIPNSVNLPSLAAVIGAILYAGLKASQHQGDLLSNLIMGIISGPVATTVHEVSKPTSSGNA